MSPIDLQAKFPELRPIRFGLLPSLWSAKGCGLFFHGCRDYDKETGSFVQTHCLCLVWIPILALGAYRVMETDEGQTILGRVPLSTLARTVNAMVVYIGLALCGHYGWLAFARIADSIARQKAAADKAMAVADKAMKELTAPADELAAAGKIARQKLAQADELSAAGKVAEAARLCQEVVQGPGMSDRTADAVRQVTTSLLDHPVARASAIEQAGVIQVATALQLTGHWSEPPETLYVRGKAMMDRSSSTDPEGALAILEVIAPLAPRADDVNASRRVLLEPLVAAHPGDPELTSRLAAVYEEQGEEERSVAMLEPLRAQLGTTEGARILGLADARLGRLDQALTLLRPYTRARLESFQAATTTVNSAITSVRGRIINELSATSIRDPGVKHESFQSVEEKYGGISKYIDSRMKSDLALRQAEQRMLRESSVVPVALELGRLLREHAQRQVDSRTREGELDEAEKLFLAVVRLERADHSDRLDLAQVYYWQGKHRDGRAILDEVLKSKDRDPWLLIRVSRLLRQVGSLSEARALAEETYKTGPNLQFRQMAARNRGLMGPDHEDNILWLRRGDPTDPQAKALLTAELANQAIDHGDEAKAIAHLREAIGLYDAMMEGPATLNNTALYLFRLSRLTGDPAAFDRGIANIEKAHKLEPANSVTMMNDALFVREAALHDIIGSSIDLRLLKQDAGINQLAFLYRDRAGRKSYVQRLRAHTGINRLIALYEKALLLAPRSGKLYQALNELYACRGEGEKQRGLLQRLERIDLDQADEIDRAREGYAGGRKDIRRIRATSAIARAESTLKSARSRKPDLTFAVAAVNLAYARMNGYNAGLETDPDAVVALAEEAYAVARSHATRQTLIDGLLFRAGRRLAHSQPAYARMAEKTRLSTSHAFLVGIALNGQNPLRDAARQDSDVRQAIDLIRAAYHDDPEYEASPWTWSLLHAMDPEEGARMARTYLNDESAQLSRAMLHRVDPISASAALSLFWAAEMVGKDADAPAILKAYALRGVPLPIESP